MRGRLTVQETGKTQYRGIWHAGTTIIREEGLLAVYKGWLPSVIGVVRTSAAACPSPLRSQPKVRHVLPGMLHALEDAADAC